MTTKAAAHARSRPAGDAAENDGPGRRLSGRRRALAAIAVAVAAVAGYLAIGRTSTWLAARQVRAAVAARRFEEARQPLRRWIEASPGSAEAQYHLARVELAADRPQPVLDAIGRARALGYDRAP